MAARGITVRDFRTEVPGKISESGVSWNFPLTTAEKRVGTQMLEWTITVRVMKAKPAGDTAIKIKDAFFDSKEMSDDLYGWIKVFKKHSDSDTWDKTTPTHVKKGKNIGKKNQTNVFTQALRDAYGIYNKHKARATPTERGNDWEAVRYPPMLVQSLGKQNIDYSDIYIQRKLDGIRTVAAIEKAGAPAGDGAPAVDATPDHVVLYSRNKKTFEGKNYLREKLLPILKYYRDERDMVIYLDGESYAHGESLQTISGEMRQTEAKENPAIRMQLYVFDVFVPAKPEMTYLERKALLDEIFERFGDDASPELVHVETIHADSKERTEQLYKEFLDEEYEGAILRMPNHPYEYSHKGYHSAYMLKMKPTFDDEFEVVSYSGKEGKGKAAGLLMLEVKTGDGTLFDITPMGTHEDRAALFVQMGVKQPNGKTTFENEWKGRMITVKYDDLSDDGVPLRGRAKALRDYE